MFHDVEVLLRRVERKMGGSTNHRQGRYVVREGTGSSCVELSPIGGTLVDLDCRDDEEDEDELTDQGCLVTA